ncbi:MAG TPA: type IV toxin-antitoxin system AbiEi family antitoxin [Candidatus Omnitrophota bacterium]|nr:type IV toxin-antitoxin system AbiEi family antitoxin [Candidatus Omnitrophota bacterium]
MEANRDLSPYLDRLAELPFLTKPREVPCPGHVRRTPPEPCIELTVGRRKRVLSVALKRSDPLSRIAIDHWIGRMKGSERDWILFANHVGPQLSRYLREHRVNFVDANGNCHLSIDEGHVAYIEGRRRSTPAWESHGTGRAGYRILFALLASPELVSRPVREIASASGASKTAASSVLNRLEGEGIIGVTGRDRMLRRPDELLQRWLNGYVDRLRPRLVFGRYETRIEDPNELDRFLDVELSTEGEGRLLDGSKAIRWAWGGAAAEHRLLHYYRGTTTVIHFDAPPSTAAARLGLAPARAGSITFLGVPGPLAFPGTQPNVVHPLLIYSELLAAGEERARDAAGRIRERYLQHLS